MSNAIIVVLVVLVVSIALLGNQPYGAIPVPLPYQCHAHADCIEPDHYCMLGYCVQKVPDYPEIGNVLVYDHRGQRVAFDRAYIIAARKPARFQVKADNEQRPFEIIVQSPIRFGPEGIAMTNVLYAPPLLHESSGKLNTYQVGISEKKVSDDYAYDFYFSPEGLRGEQFSLYVQLRSAEDGLVKSSEIIEIPLKLT